LPHPTGDALDDRLGRRRSISLELIEPQPQRFSLRPRHIQPMGLPPHRPGVLLRRHRHAAMVQARIDEPEKRLDLAGELCLGLADALRARRAACDGLGARRKHAGGQRRGGAMAEEFAAA
jgi:hypothetical protein